MTAETRILWLTENYPPQRGGMSVSCDRIVRSLRCSGLHVDVAHFSPRHRSWKSEKKRNGGQYACPIESDISHALNRFWNQIGDFDYTHVVAFGGHIPMIAAPVYAKWLSSPLITLIRGNDFDSALFSPKRGDILIRALSESAAICAVSRGKVRKISSLFPDKIVKWSPNGIETEDWEFSPEDLEFANEIRAAPGLDKKRIIGLFGQLKRKKGGLFFVENLLRSGYGEEIHLLLVGEIEPELQELLNDTAGKISFQRVPFLDRFELIPYFAACDFISIPSFYDGMPNVLLESAALGVPSISSNVDGMKDILADGRDSILFKPGNDTDCRRAIRRAARISTGELESLRKNVVQTACEFSCERETAVFLETFEMTASRKMTEVANA